MAPTSRLHIILTATNLAAGASLVIAHGLNINSVPVIPEFVDIDNPLFDVTATSSTTITVKNNGTAAATGRFEVQFRHSMVRADGPPVGGMFTPIGGTTFVRRGGGAGSSGNTQSFRYTVTGLEPDLSDFQVPLPAARSNDVYRVVATPAGMASLIPFDLPDVLAGDRTTVDFRLRAIAPLTAGDQIDFHVQDPIP